MAKMHQNLTREINNFRNTQLQYSRDESSKIRGLVLVNHPNASEDEINELIATNNNPLNKLKTSSGKKQKMSEIEARNAGLKVLNKMVSDLAELLIQMESLTRKSESTIDNIGISIQHSKIKTEKANEDLKQGLWYRIRSMRFKKALISILLIGAITWAVYLMVKNDIFPFKKKN